MNDEQAVKLLRAIRDHAGLELGAIRDAGTHGASGGFGGFTYHTDTTEFYDKNETLIWELLSEDAEEFDYDSVPAYVGSFNGAEYADNLTGFKNLVAWYALEAAGRWLNDRREQRRVAA